MKNIISFLETAKLARKQSYRNLTIFPILAPDLESLFKKVKPTLSPQTLEYLEQIQSKFHISIKPYKDYKRFRKILEKVNQATNDCRRVEMLYRPLRSKKDTHRKSILTTFGFSRAPYISLVSVI